MAQPLASWPRMSARYFYGWNVVGATFVMALFSFDQPPRPPMIVSSECAEGAYW